MSTTSGAPAGGHDGLVAVARLPDDLDVVLGLEDHAEAGPDHAWSSTSTTRIVIAATGSVRGNWRGPRTPPRAGAGPEMAAVQAGPLAHPDQAVAADLAQRLLDLTGAYTTASTPIPTRIQPHHAIGRKLAPGVRSEVMKAEWQKPMTQTGREVRRARPDGGYVLQRVPNVRPALSQAAQQLSPRQLRRPSRIASAAMARAAIGSSHHQPSSVPQQPGQHREREVPAEDVLCPFAVGRPGA